MLPGTGEAIATILLGVMPGFVLVATWSRAKTWKGPTSDLRTVLVSIALSALIQLAMSPLTIALIYPIRDDLDSHPGRVATWAFIIVILAPAVLGVLAGRWTEGKFPSGIRAREWVSRVWPESVPPTIWDWFFVTQPPFGRFVLVTFKDGTQVAGVFAEGSLALTSPEQQGLYLVSEWQLDDEGNIVDEVPGTCGILISDIESIRTISVQEGGEKDVGT